MRSLHRLFFPLALVMCSCGGSSTATSSDGDGMAGATGVGGGNDSGGTGGDPGTGGKGTGGKGSGGTGGKATGGNTGTGGKATGGTSGTPACEKDSDCSEPKVCDVDSGKCVACTEDNDTCETGSYCNAASNTCVAGCSDASDCAGNTDGAACDLTNHECVECAADADCALGKVCAGTVCVDGCTDTHACAGEETCCGGACVDVESNIDHCGTCDNKCAPGSNATTACLAQPQGCTDTCIDGFADCNGDRADGCEWDVNAGGDCVCTPGEVADCYDGPAGTEGNAPCTGGQKTCDASGTSWGACQGQVLPSFDACSDQVDNDCDGIVDNTPDRDGDGWTICNGDCCDTDEDCTSPASVNPGAHDFDNGIDDDCSGAADDAVTNNCSTGSKFGSVLPTDDAKAADICQTTTANPPLAQKKWGLISATYLTVNGTIPNATVSADFQNKQSAVTTLFGNNVSPRKNGNMFGLSTGMMRDANDAGWVTPITGTAFNNTSFQFASVGGPLGTYVSQHGNAIEPGTCGTTACPVGTIANDGIDLRLVMRVPTNAHSFAFDFRFFSAEYQTFQCTNYNDQFLALLTSTAQGIPADHNIAVGGGVPISVNSPFLNNCGGNGKNCASCSAGTGALAGTGFDQVNGAATGWLTTSSPVVPGEVITLDLMLFDVGDYIYDSLVLIDSFRWSEASLSAPTTAPAQ